MPFKLKEDKNRYQRERRASNPTRYRRYQQAWRARNSERYLLQRKTWRERNRNACNAADRACYAAHKETRRAYKQQRRKLAPYYKLLLGAHARAKQKQLPFNLTREWALATWTGRCAITGLEFDLTSQGKGPKQRSPSIDRIIPELGYITHNCRFILHCVNAMKGTGTDADVYDIARAILAMKEDAK